MTGKGVITNPEDILEEGKKMYSLYSDDDSHSVIGGQQINLIKELFFTNMSSPKSNENQ